MASTLTRPQRVALKTWTPANLKSLWAAYLKKNPGAKLPATGMAPNIGGFDPFHAPERPPPGTYDPSLDAQERAAGRGYGDLQQDTDIGNARGEDDFLLGKGELEKALARHLADLTTNRGRQHSDYELSKKQASEDYGTSLTNLQRSYDIRGAAQTDAATAAGVSAGGALQQALQKRMANQAIEKAPIDTGFQRFNQQADEGEQRSQADFDLLAGDNGRLQEDFQSQLGQLGLGLSRGNEDRANTLARAGRETTQLGTDVAAQRWYQAAAAGYDPPQRPVSQHGSLANPYKIVKTPRGNRRLYHTGQLVMR
jgi:hypothetical protein